MKALTMRQRMFLLTGSAAKEYYQNGKLSSYAWPGGYALAWYTDSGLTLCGNCATGILDEYQATCHDENYTTWDADELPKDYGIIEEGPPVLCDECNTEIFEGLEQCDGCENWFDTPQLTFTPTQALCSKCREEELAAK